MEGIGPAIRETWSPAHVSPPKICGNRSAGARELRKKKNTNSPFVMIYHAMLDGTAWRNLGNPARVAYIHIKRKCFSSNPGELTFTYEEAEQLMTRETFARAIKELEENGFIERTQRGGLYRKRNFFRLSDEWRKQSQVGKSTPSQVGKSTPSKGF